MLPKLPLRLQLVLLAFLLFGLIQAAFTPLDADEAYYWTYSLFPDWGYFDHPPMVALWIKAGSAWLGGELGVRLITVVMMPLTLVLLWKLAGEPKDEGRLNLFLLLSLAMPFFQMYGFIATPDAPLLFFTALWFWQFQYFLRQQTIKNTLFLGAIMALLLYSKYNGVLVIGFSVLANLRLLRSPAFWGASVFGFSLFLPHLYWQYSNGFPSFSYHLSGRDDVWELKFPLNYLLNQFLVFSPLLFPLLVTALGTASIRKKLRLETILVIGFWIFFGLMTFKGHVEPQWTAVLSILVVLILMEYAGTSEKRLFWTKRLSLISLSLLVLIRLGIVGGVLSSNKLFGKPDWVYELKEKSMGLPLYFENSYRDVAMYQFYTGAPATTFTNIDYRKNQFNLLDLEVPFQNQRVMMVGQKKWKCSDCRTVTLSNGHTVKLKIAESLQLSENCRLLIENIPEIWPAGDTLELDVVLENPYPFEVELGKGNLPLSLSAAFTNGKTWEETLPVLDPGVERLKVLSGERKQLRVNLPVPELKGEYRVAFGFRMGNFLPTINSKLSTVIIE